jgi:hypothetical protein
VFSGGFRLLSGSSQLYYRKLIITHAHKLYRVEWVCGSPSPSDPRQLATPRTARCTIIYARHFSGFPKPLSVTKNQDDQQAVFVTAADGPCYTLQLDRPPLSVFEFILPTVGSSIIDSPDCQAGHALDASLASSSLLVALSHQKRRGEHWVYSPKGGLRPSRDTPASRTQERARGTVPVCSSYSFCRGNRVYGRVVGRRFCDTVEPLLTHRGITAYLARSNCRRRAFSTDDACHKNRVKIAQSLRPHLLVLSKSLTVLCVATTDHRGCGRYLFARSWHSRVRGSLRLFAAGLHGGEGLVLFRRLILLSLLFHRSYVQRRQLSIPAPTT